MVISLQVCRGNVQREFTAPFVDDGLIEVVGFRDAWHGLVLLAPNGHGTRIAQVWIASATSSLYNNNNIAFFPKQIGVG